jgi:hypothetical protein
MRKIGKRQSGAVRTGMLMAVAAGVAGCTVPYGPQFREVALPAIQTGVHSILDGFVNGVFATIEPENDG